MKINRQVCGPRKGRLSYAARKLLPNSCFALPTRRWGPMYVVYKGEIYPDAEHAANAKARATQAVEAGRMTAREQALVNRRADRIIALCRRVPKVNTDEGRGGELVVRAYTATDSKVRKVKGMTGAHRLADEAKRVKVAGKPVLAVVIADAAGATRARWERRKAGWRRVS